MASHFRSTERHEDDVDQMVDQIVREVSEADELEAYKSLDELGETGAFEGIDAVDPLEEDPFDNIEAVIDEVLYTDGISGTGQSSEHPTTIDLPAVPTAEELEAEGPAPSIYEVLAQVTPPVVSHEGTPTISLQNVTHIYPSQPNKPALEDVSLDIYPGEFVFIVGHSGSGKSTFIRLLTRELRASKGKVLVAGQDLTRMRNWKVPYLRRQIGCVFQDFKLLPDKTCYENVAFALECIGKPRSVIKVQVPEVLRLVGLSDRTDAYPDQLSGGEQQRVAVARAMVNRPPLLVCDEPTGNLDPAISLGIMKLLDRINRAGTTVVMATHDREMVDSMRKRVVALEAGHVVRDQERGGYGSYV